MRQLLLTLILSAFVFTTVLAADGVIAVKSVHSVKDTADRLEKVLKGKGMTVFTRIDHAAGAKKVGKELPPTELIIFGNPKVGTPLMRCGHSVAIDLPQKALIWQDKGGQVWLSYNDPSYLASRHAIKDCGVVNKIANALKNFANAATKP